MRMFSAVPLALCLLCFVWIGPAAALRVVAATNDLGAIAQAVGGEFIKVDIIARPDRDPHTLEVRPSALRKTARADLYLSVGLSLDLWSTDIVRGSRNRDLVVVDCSDVITPLGVPAGAVDASMGDVHPEGNPHYWLDPQNGQLIAEHLATRFGSLDLEHSANYQENAKNFATEIETRLPEWDQKLRGRVFIEFHDSWIYLAKRFGVTIAGRVEPLPGIPTTARHLAGLTQLIVNDKVPIVVRDSFHDESPLDFLHRETGVEALVLASSCHEPTPESYLRHFDRIADVLGTEDAR